MSIMDNNSNFMIALCNLIKQNESMANPSQTVESNQSPTGDSNMLRNDHRPPLTSIDHYGSSSTIGKAPTREQIDISAPKSKTPNSMEAFQQQQQQQLHQQQQQQQHASQHMMNILLQAYQLSIPNNVNTGQGKENISYNVNTGDFTNTRQLKENHNVPENCTNILQSKPRKNNNVPSKIPSTKISDSWILIGEFSLEEKAYDTLYKNGRIQHHSMTSCINKTFPEAPCVLISTGGYPRTHNRRTLTYKCSHSYEGIRDCFREYKVFQILGNKFELYRNEKEVTHNVGSKVVAQVSGEYRKEVEEKLGTMTAQEYLAECEEKADDDLLSKGNLQGCISIAVAEKIRSQKLQAKDFDKDEIIDLLLMKIHQDFNNEPKQKNELSNYIRRIGLDPFFITLSSDEQYQCLKLLKELITVYIDATGGVLRFAGKKVFYYAGVTKDTTLKLKPNERHKVLPLFECLSSAHDTFNIGICLGEYKFLFHKMFPTMEWPIEHAVTDFSYALLNAICSSWNQLKLIDYINCLYDALVTNTPWSEIRNRIISTFIHICCCHLPKNFSKDVNEYFPNLDSEQQNILKEIFAGMFGIKELKTLETIWENFSAILVSKFADEKVEIALKELSKIMIPEEELLHNHENLQQEKNDEVIEQHFTNEKVPATDEHKVIYKCSKFYQRFKTIMSQESFANEDAPINCFYSPSFAKMFLQKYITVLPLWTCFDRKSNAYAEGHFKDTKKTIIANQNTYGPPPLKPGRLIRLLKSRVEKVTNSIKRGIPRYRNTGQRRKPKEDTQSTEAKKVKVSSLESVDEANYECTGQKRKAKYDTQSTAKKVKISSLDDEPNLTLDDEQNLSLDDEPNSPVKSNSCVIKPTTRILDLYKLYKVKTNPKSPSPATRKRHPSPTTPKRHPSPATPTSTRKRTHTPAKSAEQATGIDDLHVEEQWKRKSTRKFSHFRKLTFQKMQKSPTAFKKLLEKISRPSNKSQKKNSVKNLPNGLIDHPQTYLTPQESFIVARNYIAKLKLHQHDYKSLAGDNSLTSEIIYYIVHMFITQYANKNIQFEMSVGAYSFNLLKKRQPKHKVALFVNNIDTQFTLIILDYEKLSFCYIDPTVQNPAEANAIYVQFEKHLHQINKTVPEQWNQVNFEHPIVNDTGVSVINFIQQYLKNGFIHDPFDSMEYRIELQHEILRSSTNMCKMCIICGTTSDGAWVNCDCCKRWTHCTCINKTEEELKNDTIHYFCIICEANTPKSELHSLFKDVTEEGCLQTIPEELVKPSNHENIEDDNSSIVNIEDLDDDNIEDDNSILVNIDNV